MRKAFLGWWDEGVDRIWVWCLAAACARCGVTVHHAVRVGSHYHLTFTVTRNNLGEFLWSLNHSMSCALNALLDERGYEAPGQIFDGRQMHVMRVLDAEAQMASLVYERLNPVEAGLADTCDGIPGVVLGPARWRAGGYEQAKPPVFFASGPERQRLTMGPPPLLYLAFGGEVDALVHHLRKLEREGERRIRKARNGRPARTAAEVRAIDPFDEPRTGKERGGERIPSFKTGLGRDANIAGAVEVRKWRETYQAAEREWRAGHPGGTSTEVEFPHGTHLLAARYGVRVGEAGAKDRVSAPGPTLEEAKESVAAGEAQRDRGLPDRVRAYMRQMHDLEASESDPDAGAATGASRATDGSDESHPSKPDTSDSAPLPTPPPKPSPSKDEGQSPVDPRDGQRRGRRGNDPPQH